MKIQVLAAIFAAAAVFMTSCEQHSWSETKQLFSHGDHGDHSHDKDHGHGHAHGDDHKHDDHAKDEHKAAEHKDEHGAEKKEEKH